MTHTEEGVDLVSVFSKHEIAKTISVYPVSPSVAVGSRHFH